MANELKFALEEHNKTSEDVIEDGNINVQLSDNEGENGTPDNKTEFTGSKFMLNSQKREKLRNAISVKQTDEVEYYFWVMDFDEKYVYFEETIETEERYECKYYRCEYSESDGEIAIFENTKVEVFSNWLTQAELDILQIERESIVMSLNSKITELESSIESFKLDIENKDKSIEELNTFKTNVEKEIKASQVEDLLGEFEAVLKDESEFIELKAKAIDMEITQLEKELYALEGKLKHEKKNKAKDKKFNYSRVVVDVDVENGKDKEDVVAKYYGEASKYFKK